MSKTSSSAIVPVSNRYYDETAAKSEHDEKESKVEDDIKVEPASSLPQVRLWIILRTIVKISAAQLSFFVESNEISPDWQVKISNQLNRREHGDDD